MLCSCSYLSLRFREISTSNNPYVALLKHKYLSAKVRGSLPASTYSARAASGHGEAKIHLRKVRHACSPRRILLMYHLPHSESSVLGNIYVGLSLAEGVFGLEGISQPWRVVSRQYHEKLRCMTRFQ